MATDLPCEDRAATYADVVGAALGGAGEVVLAGHSIGHPVMIGR